MDGSRLSVFGSAIGDSNRARMLGLLQSGRAFTSGELARGCGLAPSTASAHLSTLVDAGLVVVIPSGRHRYYRIASEEVAELLEAIDGAILPETDEPKRPKSGSALAFARSCYDHLAGEMGVAVYAGLVDDGLVVANPQPSLTDEGHAALADFGLDMPVLSRGRRPLVRICLDWTERKNHLGGAVGAALLEQFLDRRWLRPGQDRRVLVVSEAGQRGFEHHFGFRPRALARNFGP